MSAPDRIWATPDTSNVSDEFRMGWWHGHAGQDGKRTEYVRADLCDLMQDERVRALEAENARLRDMEAIHTRARAQHWLRRHMHAPEDAEVEVLCRKHGYGAVMDAASRLWARTPHGFGAFYIGGCIGAWSDDEARAALRDLEGGE